MAKRLAKPIILLICLGWTVISLAETCGEPCFNKGLIYHEQGEYQAAAEAFESAVESDPGNSLYHLWLSKSYGKLARQSNWAQAMTLARKTRQELEVAVSLDGENLDALEDLRNYYEDAPGFLGGNREKARQIDEEITRLNNSVN